MSELIIIVPPPLNLSEWIRVPVPANFKPPTQAEIDAILDPIFNEQRQP